jgi:4-hydroxybenzoate polyprenyltransferase
VRDLLWVARPRQWTKNAVCLAALVFAGRMRDPVAQRAALLTVVCFCLTASALYIVNDIVDREADRAHPAKRNRPIAAGRLGVGPAAAAAVVLLLAAAGVSRMLGAGVQHILAAFVGINFLYDLGLRAVPIADVIVVALGFVLRVQAGIEAITAPASSWILLCMFFLALLLALGKRRGELLLASRADGAPTRKVLAAYSVPFLDSLLAITAATALVCYSLYAVTVQPSATFLVTIIPVVFGLARYLLLVQTRGEGEDPTELLTRDPALIVTGAVWGVLCVAVIYGHLHLLPDVHAR